MHLTKMKYAVNYPSFELHLVLLSPLLPALMRLDIFLFGSPLGMVVYIQEIR